MERLLRVFALVLLVAVAAAETSKMKRQLALEKIDEYGVEYRSGNKMEAIRLLNEALNLAPELADEKPPILHMLSALYLQVGQFAKSAKAAQSFLERRPDDKDVWQNYAVAMEQLGEYFQSSKAWEKVIELAVGKLEAQPTGNDENDHLASFALQRQGLVARKAGDFDASCSSFRYAIRYNNKNMDAYIGHLLSYYYVDVRKPGIGYQWLAIADGVADEMSPSQRTLLEEARYKYGVWLNDAELMDQAVEYLTREMPKGNAMPNPGVFSQKFLNPKARADYLFKFSKKSLGPPSEHFTKILEANAKRNVNPKQLKVGYIGSWPMHRLFFHKALLEVMKHHSERFKPYIISHTRPHGSVKAYLAAHGAEDVAELIDCGTIPLEDCAERIGSAGIDIIIDTMGIEMGASLRILQYEPAPIQVSMCYYTEPMNVGFMAYTIADTLSFPPSTAQWYSERAAYQNWEFALPRLDYLEESKAQDLLKTVRDERLSSEEDFLQVGCIAESIVYTTEYLDHLKEVMSRLPDNSRIMMHTFPINIDKLAARLGVDEERLSTSKSESQELEDIEHFAERRRYHMRKWPKIDVNVCGDAPEYVSEAMAMGVPTILGVSPYSGFGTKVTASILEMAGLGDLVVPLHDVGDKLASFDREALEKLRVRVKEAYASSSMEVGVNNLEDLYEKLWSNYVAGEAIDVKIDSARMQQAVERWVELGLISSPDRVALTAWQSK